MASVRGAYTALGDGWTYLNAHEAPQLPERVISGVARAFRSSVALLDAPTGSHSAPATPGRMEAATHLAAARTAIADLVGGSAESVVLGPSLPALYQSVARSLGPLVRYSSSIVLSRLDDPLLTSALEGVDAEVRWAQPDLGTGELPAYQYDEIVDGSTRLVAFSAADDLLGTLAPVEDVVEKVRARSRAWTLIDVTALAPYQVIDVDALGADIVAVELARLGGPQMAALVFRDVAMFNRVDALHPSYSGPAASKLETPVSAGLAGAASPLVDHLAAMVDSKGTRRQRLVTSMFATSDYLGDLADDLYTFLSTLPAVHILGVTGEAAAHASSERLPALTFAVRGVPAEFVHQRLFDNGLVTTITPQTPLLQEMGIADLGGAVTVSLSPFNTHADVEHLVRVVASLA